MKAHATADGIAAEQWYKRGYDVLRQGNADGARTFFDRALQADPFHANSLYFLGTIEEGRGDIARAIYFYEQTLHARPGHVSASQRLARLRAVSARSSRPPLTVERS